MYLFRSLSGPIRKAARQFPAVFLTGPRQSGKTTLLKHEFPEYRYVNLEDPELRLWAIEQPRDFLKSHPCPLIIDEAQYAPALFSYIQLIMDEQDQPGMFILSGSQNFLLMDKITQSLAGRIAVLTLLPLSFIELDSAGIKPDTNTLILRGCYPRLYQSVEDVSLFYKSYLNTYVERDVRQLSNIGNLNDFIRFLKLCAGRCGQLLNISSLATEAGITHNTCKSWLSYLTTGYVIHLLLPHHRNLNKKVVKTPKLYFTDTGLLCHLLGIDTADSLINHYMRGLIFENLVFTELLKSRINTGQNADIWFWRDNHGTEIDFILDEPNAFTAIEVKSGSNFHTAYLDNLKRYKKYNPAVERLILIYDGEIVREVQGVHLVNWKNTSSLQDIQQQQ